MSEPKHPFFRRLSASLRRAWHAVRPGPRAWTGAALGLLPGALLILLSAVWADFGGTDLLGLIIGFVAFALVGAAAALAAWLAARLLTALPGRYVAAAAAALAIGVLSFAQVAGSVRVVPVLLGLGLALSLLGAAVWVVARGGWPHASVAQQGVLGIGAVAGLAGLLVAGFWLLADGRPIDPVPDAARQAAADVTPLSLPDPSLPGPYAVRTLTYGSGTDLHRPEYGAQADLITQPVDGSLLVGGWSPLRRSYWGFGAEAMPLNGRVWVPEGEGPFPLVLIVHGNHIAEYFSDPGYGYLGELLASRGTIAVSVDENFLNISPSADLGFAMSLSEEDDARGWLLLEHLRVWQAWNQSAGNPFEGRVDLDRIALIGHSRGGEAVAVAAAFNHLPYYPDDASLAFDFGFGIRGVAAIAPIDGRYSPGYQPLPLEDVSYFVLHGTQDMDATAFIGRRMYQRLRFSDDGFHFKSALYFYGGNHGQFNTAWGRKDVIEPGARLYNLRAIMPAEEQRQIARVYLSAFVEATLRDETGYLSLFRDARSAPGWLPDTVYLTQYADSSTHLVSTFEEDIDLATTTLAGGVQQGRDFTTWREQRLYARDRSQLHTVVVYLGWDREKKPAPSFAIRLPEEGLALDEQSVLTFALADGGLSGKPAESPIDLTVEVVDGDGDVARLPLSHYNLVQPRIEARILKAAWLGTRPSSEAVLGNFEFALAGFRAMNPALDPESLAEVRLLFDRTPSGLVVLDDLGFR
ncbi:MAG TPA: MFS transporter [Anaerolineae bacterium]|nr:MFS transporter [Anaerolineae bacterium]